MPNDQASACERHLSRSRLRRLIRDDRGVVALIFALLLPILLLVSGLAVDYSKSAAVRTKLQEASDLAALAGARAAYSYLATNGYNATTIATAKANGVSAATASFNANTSNLGFATSAVGTPTLDITSTTSIVSTVAATATVPTSFMALAGISTVTINTSSSSLASLGAQYYQFVFLVDVSGSMAIGGTAADITNLTNYYNNNFKDSTQCQKTKTSFTQCAFACHDPNNVYPCTNWPDKKSRRLKAATLGINLKIDYVTDAISTFLSTVTNSIPSQANAIASIYTFGSGFTTVSSGATLSAAQTATSNIQIETIDPNNNWGYTNTTAALTTLATKLTNVGDGTTSSKRKTFVVFLTDGLEDNPGVCSAYGRCTGTSYGTACTLVKATGATFVSIEATYPVVPNDSQYDTIVAPNVNGMKTAMKGCASADAWYFSADDGTAIQSSMAAAVQQITNQIRLSQ